MTRHGIRVLAKATLIFGFVLVGLGAWTRLADAGLGCPDWPTCYGHLIWPDTPEEIARANEDFAHTPFELAKAVPEVVHRMAAAVMGLLVLALFVMALRVRRTDPHTHVWLPGFTLAFICLQAWFGYYTVSLKLWPQIVTLHLLGGMTTLGLVLWQALPYHRVGTRVPAATYWLLLLGLAVVAIQIALGGWVSSNYAALACPDFPTCHGEWLPQLNLAAGYDMGSAAIGPNYLGGYMDSISRITIHYTHRVWALLVTAILLLLVWRLWAHSRRYAVVILCALCLQLLLGVLNIVLYLPLAIAIAHNLGAAALLLSLLYTAGRVSSQ